MIKEFEAKRYWDLFSVQRWRYNWFYENVYDQISPTEYQIQKWWADRIDLIGKSVNILNSGVGFFAAPMAIEKGAYHTRLIDMDPITKEISFIVNECYSGENYNDAFSHYCMDVTFDYKDIPETDIYINTSCEHSYPMKNVIPEGKMCILSGCNLTKRGHINLIQSCDDLIEQASLTHVINTDEMIFTYDDELGKREYNQYFVIGIK